MNFSSPIPTMHLYLIAIFSFTKLAILFILHCEYRFSMDEMCMHNCLWYNEKFVVTFFEGKVFSVDLLSYSLEAVLLVPESVVL
jgi:hypothetical protein